jgi:hypothetical protein
MKEGQEERILHLNILLNRLSRFTLHLIDTFVVRFSSDDWGESFQSEEIIVTADFARMIEVYNQPVDDPREKGRKKKLITIGELFDNNA